MHSIHQLNRFLLYHQMIQVLTLIYQSHASHSSNDHVPNNNYHFEQLKIGCLLTCAHPQSTTSDGNSDDIHQMKRFLCHAALQNPKKNSLGIQSICCKTLASVIDQVVIHVQCHLGAVFSSPPKNVFGCPAELEVVSAGI